ncbi:GNAT family N-acetyltransferase [Macrococcoides bohemicum]|uniref:GNAT family N-acetyltransferase n=1 Tax=Macrococcoides bohemicum TaxID=1903056 RepID=UPI001FD082D7|nr:GNAT family N-acetyltransferase [Macrococcus bohemicus]
MIETINEQNRALVIEFFNKHWGSSEMVVSSGRYNCAELPGLVNMEDEKITGLLTYIIKDKMIEIISLDSVIENRGIGTQLMNFLERLAYKNCMFNIRVITTNDNMIALKFYQKLGYRIKEIIPDAVNEARLIKPQIPLVAENGIPILDELVLEKFI